MSDETFPKMMTSEDLNRAAAEMVGFTITLVPTTRFQAERFVDGEWKRFEFGCEGCDTFEVALERMKTLFGAENVRGVQ
ncbi:MAG TPA: hypothetical protein VFE52_08545 [Devosia sp.]|nr:hypothetical protein [Devosia sp.]